MHRKKQKVFAMLSGGVDSSVAAALLTEQGFDMVGVFMKNWGQSQPSAISHQPFACQWMQDERDARRVAARLDIPFYVLNFEKDYQERVFEPFLQEIRQGKTPNPDVFCNEYIKFGVFLERALSLGADFVATGHYARIKKSYKLQATSYKLIKAKDVNKDQTYFLYRLNQFQLSKTLFPIGEYTKSEVRTMARERGLPTADKPDSQGICFVGEEPFEAFLSHFIPSRKGMIVDRYGKQIGVHRGVERYTIGQRRGLGVGGLSTPLFVAKKDISQNLLTAVPEQDELLYRKEVKASHIHWISGKSPALPLSCKARIRYRQFLQHCSVEAPNDAESTQNNAENFSARFSVKSASVRVAFRQNQRAVTPGQAVVWYKGEEVLGGGIIDS